jgi:mono/diheme cytochrome c family protein
VRPPFAVAVLAAAALIQLLDACSRAPEVPDAASSDPRFLPIRQTYRIHCGACHGRNGDGAPNLFPPLRGSRWVTGDPTVPIRIVLHGLEGRVEVEGATYLNRMPGHGERLDDETVAGILTYVRRSWGNAADSVSAAEVARVRARYAARKSAWTQPELGIPN